MKKVNVAKLQDTLLRAISEHYSQDSVRPGLVLSYLGPDWYASVARYPSGCKSVVAKAQGETMEAAIRTLAHNWNSMVNPRRDAIKELDRAIGGAK